MSDVPPPPPDFAPHRGGPLRLEYEQLPATEQRLQKWLIMWSLFIAGGWAPFVCGIITGAATAQSGSATLIRQHFNAEVLFMACGFLISLSGAIGMVRMRNLIGFTAACAVLIAQLSIALCVGLA